MFEQVEELYPSERAKRWVAAQAERLGVTPGRILEGVKRFAHQPCDIEAMTDKADLDFPVGIRVKVVGYQEVRKIAPGYGRK